MKGFTFCTAFAAAAALASTPALAAGGHEPAGGFEQRQAAFAGATVRLELGGRAAAAPELRLGIGFSQHRRDPAGFVVSRGELWLPIEAGLMDGRLELFVGGERFSRLERRLGAGGSRSRTLIILGGIAVGAVAATLLLGGDDDGNPCPPGVEVCAS